MANVVNIQRLRNASIVQILPTDNVKDYFLKSKENLRTINWHLGLLNSS